MLQNHRAANIESIKCRIFKFVQIQGSNSIIGDYESLAAAAKRRQGQNNTVNIFFINHAAYIMIALGIAVHMSLRKRLDINIITYLHEFCNLTKLVFFR